MNSYGQGGIEEFQKHRNTVHRLSHVFEDDFRSKAPTSRYYGQRMGKTSVIDAMGVLKCLMAGGVAVPGVRLPSV